MRRGDVRQAIIVRTKKKVQRKDGMVVKFDDNACALVGKNGEPIGTRINGQFNWDISKVNVRMVLILELGIVGAELRHKQQSKILSLASLHV